MPNRYEAKYGDYVSKMLSSMRQDPAEMAAAREKEDYANDWAGLASFAAPVAGAAIGGVVGSAAGPEGTLAGMKTGSQIGGTAGQAAGQAFSNQGQNAMDPIRRRELQRQALLQAIMSAR